MKKRSALFVIEVIIASSVTLLLVGILFSVQSVEPPSEDPDALSEQISFITKGLKENGELYDYFGASYLSYYNNITLANEDLNKIEITNSFRGALPDSSQFSISLHLYEDSSYVLVDQYKSHQAILPSTVISFEYISQGIYNQLLGVNNFVFKFVINAWYQV